MISALRGPLLDASGPFCLFIPLPCPSASTPGEGLPGGLLEGLCDRRHIYQVPGMYIPRGILLRT